MEVEQPEDKDLTPQALNFESASSADPTLRNYKTVTGKSALRKSRDSSVSVDGSHRGYKVTFSPEHTKHKGESLQGQNASVLREAQLEALRKGGSDKEAFVAFSLVTPVTTPTKQEASATAR